MTISKHTIRIISGTHRSRRLPVLNFEGLRPTGDRVRETLFNWLQMLLAGRQVLDLCAGAGSLGFESASRGAQQVIMVEKQTAVATQLKNIVRDFNFTNVAIYHLSAQTYLNSCQQKFDVVFLDPPFADQLLKTLTALVLDKVNMGGFLYLEAALHQEPTILPKNWELYRQKTMGRVRIELWRKNKNTPKQSEETKHA